MALSQISTKRIAISKANTQIVIVVAVASFLTIFCLFAAKAVWSQNSYRAKVISKKETAHLQLQTNVTAAKALVTSYQKFVDQPTNVLKGNTYGTQDNDGDNAKIILDALPSTYDFPALTSSIEKILGDKHIEISSITGTDDQVAQEANTSSPNPQPVSIPFSFTVADADYASIQQLFTTLESSIRPMAVDTVTISGGSNKLTATVTAHTYYQPATNLTITKQVVK